MTEPTPDPAALLCAAADRLRQPIGPEHPAIVAPTLQEPLAEWLREAAEMCAAVARRHPTALDGAPWLPAPTATARAILANDPTAPAHGGQGAATAVRAGTETPDTRSSPQKAVHVVAREFGRCGHLRQKWTGPYRLDDICHAAAGHTGAHGPWAMLPPGPPDQIPARAREIYTRAATPGTPAALRDRITEALHATGGPFANTTPEDLADAVLAVVQPELDEANATAQRLRELRQDLAEERYAWQLRGDRAERRRDVAEKDLRRLRRKWRAERDRAEQLLRDTADYLAVLHTHAGRHDVLDAGTGCAGCHLHQRITTHLDQQ